MGIPANQTVFGKTARIKISGETGTIVAFSRHTRVKEPSFQLEYQGADGRAAEAWFNESQIELI